MKKALDWLVARPWIMQAFMGLIWLYFVIVAIGKGQEFAVFMAFFGMLIWATSESAKCEIQSLLDQALKGWKETIDLWTASCETEYPKLAVDLRAKAATIPNASTPASEMNVTAEPVAWANWRVGTQSYVPKRTREEAEESVRNSSISTTQEGPYKVVPLYAAPQPITNRAGESADAAAPRSQRGNGMAPESAPASGMESTRGGERPPSNPLDKQAPTPRCDALHPLDSFDCRAWSRLARQLERELAACSTKLDETVVMLQREKAGHSSATSAIEALRQVHGRTGL